MRGGFVVEREGLRRFSKATKPLVPWNHLEQVRSDPIELVLRSTSGQTWTLCCLTNDFWQAMRWIIARVK